MAKDNGDPAGELIRATARSALLRHVLELSGRRGFANLTTQELVEASGTTQERFDDLFANLEDCYATAYEDWMEIFWGKLSDRCSEEPTWSTRMRAALEFVVVYAQEEPEVAEGAIAQAAVAGSRVTDARGRLFERLSRAVDSARRETVLSRHSPPPATAPFIVSGIAWSVERTLGEKALGQLAEQAPDLLFFAVMPYLGEDAARAERQAMLENLRRR